MQGTLLPSRLSLFRKAKAIYIDDGHTQLLNLKGQSSQLTAHIHHDDRKPLSRWFWAQDRYMIIEAKKLLETPAHELSWGDRIRKQKVLAPFVILIYCLILKGGILDGWHGWYYAFQRVLAELVLSIRLLKQNSRNRSAMRLDQYTLNSYTPGAPYWKQLLWYFIGSPLVETSWLPISAVKVQILRCFGSQIGQGVRIKPKVRIKFPWRLRVGDYVWIGENVWIDNLAMITIESHVCLSQGVYLCTGNHDWNHPHFKLLTASIYIEEGSWLAAQCVVGPGVTIGKGTVLALGSVASQSLKPMMIYAGNPAQPIKVRSPQPNGDVNFKK